MHTYIKGMIYHMSQDFRGIYEISPPNSSEINTVVFKKLEMSLEWLNLINLKNTSKNNDSSF